jgi:hypothetical protein
MMPRETQLPARIDRVDELLRRFGEDFDQKRTDMAGYYSDDFRAVVGDEAVDRETYLAAITAMYDAGVGEIAFAVDHYRHLAADLCLASGTTYVRDSGGARHASRFTFLCGGTGDMRFVHVHSSAAREVR